MESVQCSKPEMSLLPANPPGPQPLSTTQISTQCGTSGGLGYEIHPIPAPALEVHCSFFAHGRVKQISKTGSSVPVCTSQAPRNSLSHLAAGCLNCHSPTTAGLSGHCNTTLLLPLLLPVKAILKSKTKLEASQYQASGGTME